MQLSDEATGSRPGLAQQRKVAGLNQERPAEQLGVDRSTVVRWEAGETETQPWLRLNLAETRHHHGAPPGPPHRCGSPGEGCRNPCPGVDGGLAPARRVK
ncbi:helix-turn-helix domain-containing protein [Kribbella sp.]|uniref:helix-turn-helix domain-containing protein n=1 Tax=Kribbella sp. TaxID=1871183 RepID=UPI0039C95EEF